VLTPPSRVGECGANTTEPGGRMRREHHRTG
jgi:hypothetical protein